MKEIKDKRAIELIKENILFMSDCNNINEAIDYFESIRHKPSPFHSREYFDYLVRCQLAILFKLLIDLDEISISNNKIDLIKEEQNLNGENEQEKKEI